MKTVLVAALLSVALAALLSGCASYGLAKTAIAVEGAKASDEARIASEWMLCQGITVGAWRRGYADNDTKATAWAVLCEQPNGVPK